MWENILKYIIIFVLFSVVGYFYERYIVGKKDTTNPLDKLLNTKLPILPLYGLCGVILFLIWEKMHVPIIAKIIIAAILLNSVECIAGLASYNFYRYKTWKYEKCLGPICHGYVSIVTFTWWTILIAIFFLSLENYKIYQSK